MFYVIWVIWEDFIARKLAIPYPQEMTKNGGYLTICTFFLIVQKVT